MVKKSIKVMLTIAVGGVFLWLAFQNVKLSEIWFYTRQISLGWILPFVAVALLSHYLRAERWKLLLEQEKENLDRITLYSGVMTGYMTNIVLPRMGELTRPVYVAKRENLSSSKLIGTIVLERIIDIGVMAVLMVIISIYLITDISLLSQIFGEEAVDFFREGLEIGTWIWVVSLALLFAAGGYALVKLIEFLSRRFDTINLWYGRAQKGFKMFKDGILAVRKVRRWGLFVVLTVLIWFGYTLMSYIPFWMFDMHTGYDLSHLTLLDALVITVISAIGIALPSPGGLGTYHYFVKQTLLVLFGVPAVAGLTYATVTHAATVLLVSLATPVILSIDKLRLSRRGISL